MNKKNIFEYVISACLVGIPCRFNGKSKLNEKALDVFLKGKSIAVCPELFANMETPRPACEICCGDGCDVIKGSASVLDNNGKDYSKQFICGAKIAIDEIVKKHGIKKAILKSGSPSCGSKSIYSGKFNGKKKRGDGVFACLLKKEGVKILTLD